MRKSLKQFSTASIGAFSITVLAGSSAFACGAGSNYQDNQSSSTYSGNYYSDSSHGDMNQSAYLTNSYTYSYTPDYTSGYGRGSTGTNTNALQRRLDMQLRRHAMLAGQLLRLQHQQTNLQSAIENNNQAIADTVNQLYPGTRSQFLRLWRDHIDYYQQYLTASEENNNAGRQQARQELTNFESDMADLFENANSQLDNANLEQQITMHVDHTLSYIDNLVSGDRSGYQRHDYMDMSNMMDSSYDYSQSQ